MREIFLMKSLMQMRRATATSAPPDRRALQIRKSS